MLWICFQVMYTGLAQQHTLLFSGFKTSKFVLCILRHAAFVDILIGVVTLPDIHACDVGPRSCAHQYLHMLTLLSLLLTFTIVCEVTLSETITQARETNQTSNLFNYRVRIPSQPCHF